MMVMAKKHVSSSQKEARLPGPPSGRGHGLVVPASPWLLADEGLYSVFIKKYRKLSSKGPTR